VIGLSLFEVGCLEFALVLFFNAGEGVQAVKGVEEACGRGGGVLEGTSGVNGEHGVRGGRALRVEIGKWCARARLGVGHFHES